MRKYISDSGGVWRLLYCLEPRLRWRVGRPMSFSVSRCAGPFGQWSGRRRMQAEPQDFEWGRFDSSITSGPNFMCRGFYANTGDKLLWFKCEQRYRGECATKGTGFTKA